MIVAIHQPNFIPPFPYFVKMGICDKFVILNHVQFSKSNYQNFQMVFGKRWAVPVSGGDIPIIDKKYVSGQSLSDTNVAWIIAIARTLGISVDDKIVFDRQFDSTKTQRIVDIVKFYGGDSYIANESAPHKYLDVELLAANGIDFLGLKCAETRNVLELFDAIGIEKTIEMFNYIVNRYKVSLGRKDVARAVQV